MFPGLDSLIFLILTIMKILILIKLLKVLIKEMIDVLILSKTMLDHLARGLSIIINIIDPDIIILGGGMSNIDYIYDNINSQLTKYVFSDTLHTKVVKNVHGDSSGVRGAAWL